MAGDFSLEDSSNLDTGTETLTGRDAKDALKESARFFNQYNTKAWMKDNVLKELTVVYMP